MADSLQYIADSEESLFKLISKNIMMNDYDEYIEGQKTLPVYESMGELYEMLNTVNEAIVASKLLSKYDSSDNVEEPSDSFSIKINKNQLNGAKVQSYENYTVKSGDDLNTIAIKFFADADYSRMLSLFNKLSPRDFEEDNMIGKTIKIPQFHQQDEKFLLKNQVFSYMDQSLLNSKQKEIDKLGVDLKLKSGSLTLNEEGDLDLDTGSEAWVSNLSDRLSNRQGSLNELHPGWGVSSLSGNLLGKALVEKLLDSIRVQALKDPRTKEVLIQDYEVLADSLSIDAVFYNVLGQAKEKQFSQSIA